MIIAFALSTCPTTLSSTQKQYTVFSIMIHHNSTDLASGMAIKPVKKSHSEISQRILWRPAENLA